jgi:hypothetical protein
LFSNDRFMTMATGLVLAIAVGTMAQNSKSLMAFFTGEDISIGHDDQFTIRAGKDQALDVLANDSQSGNISIIGQPACGTVRAGEGDTLEFINSGSCSGNVNFTYCVPSEGDCEAFEVTLNVINVADPIPATETQVASAVVQPAEVTPAPAPNSEPETYTQGDRLVAGQILVNDDKNDVAISGFGANSGPSLFAPDMEELIQPQETVATLRRSVAGVAPSRIDQDQNIQTQTSATPTQVATVTNTQQDAVPLGTEASPFVAFFTPSQPQLTRPSGLAPASPAPGSSGAFERAPDVNSNAPTQVADTNAGASDVQTPAVSGFGNTSVTATAMIVPSSGVDPVSADTTTAPIGNILMASGFAASGNNDNAVFSTASANIGTSAAPTIGESPVLEASADTVLIEVGPEVVSAAPSVIEFEDNTIDNLVASISGDNGYLAAITSAGDALVSRTSPDAIATPEIQSASLGAISINAADPADSSDIVVEMAAQILLPSPQLNNSLTRFIQPTPKTEALLSDRLFAADLEESAPPSTDPVEVASIAPVVTQSTNLNASPSECGVRMSASARPGASIAVFVSSICRAGQVATLTHSDLSFSLRADERGVISTTIPAFASLATVEVIFDDGATTSAQISLRDASDLERLAIVWTAPVNLDLHAFEDDADENSKGHIWINNQRTYRDTLIGGGGFHETFGDSSIEGGSMAEVYSLPTSRIRRDISVSLDLRINNIDAYCAQTMALRTVRSENGGEITKREFNLRLPQCGIASGGLILEDFVENIGVASN